MMNVCELCNCKQHLSLRALARLLDIRLWPILNVGKNVLKKREKQRYVFADELWHECLAYRLDKNTLLGDARIRLLGALMKRFAFDIAGRNENVF